MNPYETQPKKSFWRTGVSEHSPLEIPDIYQPRFAIDRTTRITCAGSCFAQHIGAQFKKRGYAFNDLEKPPEALAPERWNDFGFNLYSARFGNIYTVRQLLQMFARASGELTPTLDAYVEANGRARDPFRPAIEPDGFASLDEMHADRAYHLEQVAKLLECTDLFVFTLGLTEAWECVDDGVILPTCPGTIGGTFDPAKYRLKNFRFGEIFHDAKAFIDLARSINPKMKFLLTVSPVPLTATATDDHVLVATMYSKSVLRAVAGTLRDMFHFVDYFPSYELVAAHPMRAMHYEPNLRNVASTGVAHVMSTFFNAIGDSGEADTPVATARKSLQRGAAATPSPGANEAGDNDLVCEEAILDAFGR